MEPEKLIAQTEYFLINKRLRGYYINIFMLNNFFINKASNLNFIRTASFFKSVGLVKNEKGLFNG